MLTHYTPALIWFVFVPVSAVTAMQKRLPLLTPLGSNETDPPPAYSRPTLQVMGDAAAGTENEEAAHMEGELPPLLLVTVSAVCWVP